MGRYIPGKPGISKRLVALQCEGFNGYRYVSQDVRDGESFTWKMA